MIVSVSSPGRQVHAATASAPVANSQPSVLFLEVTLQLDSSADRSELYDMLHSPHFKFGPRTLRRVAGRSSGVEPVTCTEHFTS